MNVVSEEMKLVAARYSQFRPQRINAPVQRFRFYVAFNKDQSNYKIGAGTLSEFEADVSRLIHKNKHKVIVPAKVPRTDKYPEVPETIAHDKTLDDNAIDALKKAIADFKGQFKA